MTPAFSAMFGLARVPQCHCRGETGRVGFPRLLDGRGGCGCRCLGHSISSEWCAGAGGRCSRRAGAARWPRPVRQHCDSCHGGQGASQPANTRKVLQTSVRTVRNSGGEGENLRLHAEIASDAPLAHERQKRVRTITSASDGRPVIVHRRHVAPAVVVLGPRPSTCGKMKTRKVLQTSVRSVRSVRSLGKIRVCMRKLLLTLPCVKCVRNGGGSVRRVRRPGRRLCRPCVRLR